MTEINEKIEDIKDTLAKLNQILNTQNFDLTQGIPDRSSQISYSIELESYLENKFQEDKLNQQAMQPISQSPEFLHATNANNSTFFQQTEENQQSKTGQFYESKSDSKNKSQFSSRIIKQDTENPFQIDFSNKAQQMQSQVTEESTDDVFQHKSLQEFLEQHQKAYQQKLEEQIQDETLEEQKNLMDLLNKAKEDILKETQKNALLDSSISTAKNKNSLKKSLAKNKQNQSFQNEEEQKIKQETQASKVSMRLSHSWNEQDFYQYQKCSE